MVNDRVILTEVLTVVLSLAEVGFRISLKVSALTFKVFVKSILSVPKNELIKKACDEAPVGGFCTLFGKVTVIVDPFKIYDGEVIVNFWSVLSPTQFNVIVAVYAWQVPVKSKTSEGIVITKEPPFTVEGI